MIDSEGQQEQPAVGVSEHGVTANYLFAAMLTQVEPAERQRVLDAITTLAGAFGSRALATRE